MIDPDSTKPQIFEYEKPGRDFQLLQTHRAETNERSAECQTVCQTQCAIAADRVQSQPDRPAVCRRFDFLSQLFVIEQDNIAAFGTQFVKQLCATHYVHGFESEVARDRYHRAPDRGVSRVLNQPISLREIDIVVQQS